MTLRLKIVLFLAALSLAPTGADARVHRRNVGPVILDLGTLPKPPISTGYPQPPAEQPIISPESEKSGPQPVMVEAIYPAHRQVLGALVLTAHAPVETQGENKTLILSEQPAPATPVLIAHRYPALAKDYALLHPSVETTPKPVDAADAPPVAPAPGIKTAAASDYPLPHLRSLVIWVWRLLFLIGFGALTLLLFRRRRRAGKQVLPQPSDVSPEPELSRDLVQSRIMRATGAYKSPSDVSPSLKSGISSAIPTPGSGSKAYNLTDPGPAGTSTTKGGRIRDEDLRGQQAPS